MSPTSLLVAVNKCRVPAGPMEEQGRKCSQTMCSCRSLMNPHIPLSTDDPGGAVLQLAYFPPPRRVASAGRRPGVKLNLIPAYFHHQIHQVAAIKLCLPPPPVLGGAVGAGCSDDRPPDTGRR